MTVGKKKNFHITGEASFGNHKFNQFFLTCGRVKFDISRREQKKKVFSRRQIEFN